MGPGGQPGDHRAVAGRGACDRRLAATCDGGTGRPRRRGRAAVRRLPVRRRPRHDVGRAAPQDHARARWHVQPRPRRRALRRAPACRRLQRAGPARRDGRLAEALGTPGEIRRRACGTWRRRRTCRHRWPRSASSATNSPRRRTRAPPRSPTTLGRSTKPGCSGCWSARSMVSDQRHIHSERPAKIEIGGSPA